MAVDASIIEGLQHVDVFFQDEIQRNLGLERFSASVILVSSAVLFGMLPLLLRSRWFFDCEQARSVLETLRRPGVVTATIHALLCSCVGQLVAVVALKIVPDLRERAGSESSSSFMEICLAGAFLEAYLLRECYFIFFGNIDGTLADKGHVQLVQFIDRESRARKFSSQPQETSYATPGNGAAMEGSPINGVTNSGTQTTVPPRAEISYATYIGVILMCSHSVLHGFCLMLQKDDRSIWFVLVGLVIHRAVLALLTGAELVAANYKSTSIAMVALIYGVLPALGVFFNMLPAFSGEGVQAIAITFWGGSLLYVIAFQLFRNDRNEYLSVVGQSTAMISGFTIPMLLCVFCSRCLS